MKTKYDLIVVGGGFAGTAAAITAAEKGVDVLLIEKFNCLGGAMSSSLVMPFMNYWSDMPDGSRQYLCGDVFMRMVKEMQAHCPAQNMVALDEEVLKLVLNRMATAAGVRLLFDTTVTGVTVEEGRILSLRAISTAREMEFTADHFIDATGDAELSTLAGCTSMVGRAPDHLCQPMTLCFRMAGVDKAKYAAVRPQITPLYRTFQAEGKIRNPFEQVLVFDTFQEGVLHFNSTRVVKHDPTDPFAVTEAELQAREQVFELWQFLHDNVDGFQNARVLSTAMHIGIRESRKVEGEYTITVEDLKSLCRFPDGIATANYDIDIHNPEGAGTSHYYFGKGEWYEIPYRCLLPRNMQNLLVAGRCVSATHEAQASLRIMPYCAEMGQAAGTAVSVAKASGTTVRDVPMDKVRAILHADGIPLTL